MGKQRLQLFELHVLLAMLRMGGDTYSVPLVLELERRTGRAVAQAAVFITLGRLEKKRLVVSRIEELESGRVRRYFKVTKQGLAVVKDTREEHARLWHRMSHVLRSQKS
jgi:DNA-binding PadR family transcriptional regulator